MQNGRSWEIVETIAYGTHCTVSLAYPRGRTPRTKLTREGRIVRAEQFPPLIAVKSAEISDSALLQKEKQVLANLQGCPQILHFYEEEFTQDNNNGNMIYNLLVEHASGGSLFEMIKKNSSIGGIPESDVKRYTRSILLGLDYIHRSGYVHLDIKPSNVLLVPTAPSFCLKKRKKGGEGSKFDAKIAGFGISKRIKRTLMETRMDRSCLVGTPQYMSPESISEYKQDPPCDIWAVGCVVAEMLSGKPVHSCKPGEDVYDLLDRIGVGGELPKIPAGISKEGADFLKRCFVRNSQFRWTAEMLLIHPFVSEAHSHTT